MIKSAWCQLNSELQDLVQSWMKYFVLVFEIVRDDCTVFLKSNDGTEENSNYKTCLVGADSAFNSV